MIYYVCMYVYTHDTGATLQGEGVISAGGEEKGQSRGALRWKKKRGGRLWDKTE